MQMFIGIVDTALNLLYFLVEHPANQNEDHYGLKPVSFKTNTIVCGYTFITGGGGGSWLYSIDSLLTAVLNEEPFYQEDFNFYLAPHQIFFNSS